MNDMPLDLSQGVSQVQRQRRPHATHSTCALSLPVTILVQYCTTLLGGGIFTGRRLNDSSGPSILNY